MEICECHYVKVENRKIQGLSDPLTPSPNMFIPHHSKPIKAHSLLGYLTPGQRKVIDDEANGLATLICALEMRR